MRGKVYDIAIIGGGLAGLASAIEAAKQNRKVVLIEKEEYPFHKVCGEYISNESWAYLKYLGLPLEKMQLPQIDQLKISTIRGTELNHSLKKGGFGISRYTLDDELSKIAKNLGVELREKAEVTDLSFNGETHSIIGEGFEFRSTLLIGSFGKRSRLDKMLNRNFIEKPLPAKQNYVAVKYHLEADLPPNLIGLHIFKDGYCGISKVEGQKRYCLCYLTLANNLKKSAGIEEMEKSILSANPYLKQYLQFKKLYDQPKVIAQVNFSTKRAIENHVFMLGDAAGLIVPLCGNGMSMALHAAHGFSQLSKLFFDGTISRAELEMKYQKWWRKEFALRLRAGRLLQDLFYKPFLSNLSLRLLGHFPRLTDYIVGLTHGRDIK